MRLRARRRAKAGPGHPGGGRRHAARHVGHLAQPGSGRDAQGLWAGEAFQAGAAAVAFDIIFAEGQNYEAEQDAQFAEVIAGPGAVFLASALQSERARVYSASERAAAAERLANRYAPGTAQAEGSGSASPLYRASGWTPARIRAPATPWTAWTRSRAPLLRSWRMGWIHRHPP
ncbi:CHASE2 domain-containing protein [bacterium]|nr:CHASE2 domain-containing protein [bacterium]